jgi:hypothetical protein
MINRISELRNKATERANYYTKINFPNLAEEFTEFVNILNEMEEVVRQRDELLSEKESQSEKESLDFLKDLSPQQAIKAGMILQTLAAEEERRKKNEI